MTSRSLSGKMFFSFRIYKLILDLLHICDVLVLLMFLVSVL